MSAASAHGHVLLRWLAERPMSTEELRQRVIRELGESVRFHTCDTTQLSLEALLDLLAHRGKIALGEGRWQADVTKMCGDESPH